MRQATNGLKIQSSITLCHVQQSVIIHTFYSKPLSLIGKTNIISHQLNFT